MILRCFYFDMRIDGFPKTARSVVVSFVKWRVSWVT